MIARLITLVQNTRSRPPSPATAVIGAALVAAGLGLMGRFQSHLLNQISAAGDELDQANQDLAMRQAQHDVAVGEAKAVARRVEQLRAQQAQLEQQLHGAAVVFPLEATTDEG